ncbi:hypothetical protein [Streptomyces erythrochromogenes]|uniref:hypothetical protein n=1 Tax=Streptomyces erythrochromogenes TaxID=285574 RepID=UPI002251D866|nr:hypothetical protein [Streptomyces erythrochromogenes]MCX5587544.1 hypothetical protein [Streptomyces erythrochromogenes]
MVIPGWLLRHEVTIEAYLGDTSTGPSYAAPVTARAYVEEKAKTVRGRDGEEVTASTTVWLLPTQECPPESRVTVPTGRTASVITSSLYDGGGLPTPDHREVTLT